MGNRIGIGLAVAGVPFAALLTAAMFLLAVAQIGATPVLAGAALWLYWTGNTGWAIAMVVWAVVVGTMAYTSVQFIASAASRRVLIVVDPLGLTILPWSRRKNANARNRSGSTTNARSGKRPSA